MQLRQVCDDVRAILSTGHGEEHLRSGHECLWIGEPSIQGVAVPHDVRILQCRRVCVARHRACYATHDAAVSWTDIVFVNGVASHTDLVNHPPVSYVAGVRGGWRTHALAAWRGCRVRG